MPAAPPLKKIIIPQKIITMHIGAKTTFEKGASNDVSEKKHMHIGMVQIVVNIADKAVLTSPPEYP